MKMKHICIFLFAAAIVFTGIMAVAFYTNKDKNHAPQVNTPQEPSVTLNAFIAEAMTVYVTAPYKRFAENEIRKYFSRDIANEILSNYEPFHDPHEETVIEFEEQVYPVIGSINIQFDSGEYAVKLLFGEVYYNYRVTVTPNRVITNIYDGGISFE